MPVDKHEYCVLLSTSNKRHEKDVDLYSHQRRDRLSLLRLKYPPVFLSRRGPCNIRTDDKVNIDVLLTECTE